MDRAPADMHALAELLDAFNRSSATMEEAYRRLETRIGELDRELALTNDYLSNLLESISDGVIAIGPDETIVRFNRAAGVILGYAAADVEGRPFRDVFDREFSPPDGAEALRTKSGRMAPVRERNAPIRDPQGRRLGSVKVFQDLSELTALREQVRQIDRLAAIGEMAATVAHEIRNPLGAIKGFATFLADDLPENDAKRRLVDKILEGARRLDRVVNELLAYTRPIDVHLRPTPCAAVAAAAIADLQYDPARIAVSADIDPALKMLADADRIRQVLANLLGNAIQSIDGAGRVALTARAGAAHIHLDCTDTGCGIPEEHHRRIFSPFFTTKEKGTGLGLAIVQKIVDSHGGSIALQSAPGQGSTFTLRLPRAE